MRILALLILSAPALAAERLSLDAGFTEDGASIRVRVEGDFPARTQVVLRVFGDVGSSVPPFEVRDLTVPVREAGRAEALVLLPEGCRGLRAYRVKAAVPANRQYPELRHALGKIGPVETLLTSDLASLERLRLITDEEAFVRGLLDEAGRFIVKMNEGKAGAPASLEVWRAWRPAPRAALEAGNRRGRVDQRRIFPSVNTAFSNRFVQTLLTTENVWLCRAAGIPVMGDDALGAVSDKILEPFAETFRKESLEARLEALKALREQIEAELAVWDLGVAGPAQLLPRWERRRKGWDAWLALWPSNLDLLPQGKDLAELGKALSAWLQAEQARILDPMQEGAEECAALKAELSKRLDALTPAPSP